MSRNRPQSTSAESEKTGARYHLDGTAIACPEIEPGLHVVATPIGNLGDITLRALATLAAADMIACEDTRITSRLTRHYGIDTRLITYHEHNAARQRPYILRALEGGGSVALVSDAGTPLLSDPGYRLVTETIAAGHRIVPIPGPSALLAGLVGAGLPTDAFMFAGFLPPKQSERRKRLAELATVPGPLVFYEAPQRVAGSLADMAAELGAERSAVVARELTKMFETFRRGTLAELADAYAGEPAPKGEIVVLVGPPQATGASEDDIDGLLRERMESVPLAEAVADVTAATGAPRKLVYRRALAIKAGEDDR